jgi:hypothetical protein
MDAQNNKDRIKQGVKGAFQTKLTGMGLKSEKAENLAPIVTDLIAEGKTKEEVNTTLKTLIGEEYYKPSFTDWLFGYATFFNINQPAQTVEPDNEEVDISSDEEEEKKEEKPAEETKAQSQKNTLVKRRLSRSASSLDLASEVQKEVYGQAMAIAATTESLNKKQSEKTLEKKKSFSRRRESVGSSYAGSESGEKSHIRCQYWPNCNRGETCKFWHPKELCRKYPNCPDGDHCLYIHPAPLSKPPTKPQSPAFSSHASDAGSVASNSSTIECKFGANCTRPDCKFSHPSPAAIVAMMQAKQKQSSHTVQSKASSEDLSTINIPCRYEPNCSRADCRFLHTTPRKF